MDEFSNVFDSILEALDKFIVKRMFDKKYSLGKRILFISIFVICILILFSCSIFLAIELFDEYLIVSICFGIVSILLIVYLIYTFVKRK